MGHIAEQTADSYTLTKGDDQLLITRWADGSMKVYAVGDEVYGVTLDSSQVASLIAWLQRRNQAIGLVGG